MNEAVKVPVGLSGPAALYDFIYGDLFTDEAEYMAKVYPTRRELEYTIEIVRHFAKEHGHRIWISRIFNPLVWLGSFFLPSIPKMFADSYYAPEMSKYDFDYQIVSFKESLKGWRLGKR